MQRTPFLLQLSFLQVLKFTAAVEIFRWVYAFFLKVSFRPKNVDPGPIALVSVLMMKVDVPVA